MMFPIRNRLHPCLNVSRVALDAEDEPLASGHSRRTKCAVKRGEGLSMYRQAHTRSNPRNWAPILKKEGNQGSSSLSSTKASVLTSLDKPHRSNKWHLPQALNACTLIGLPALLIALARLVGSVHSVTPHGSRAAQFPQTGTVKLPSTVRHAPQEKAQHTIST